MFVVHVHDSFSEGMFRMFVQGFLNFSGLISGMLFGIHEQLRGQCSDVSDLLFITLRCGVFGTQF